jgi:hypothetical protein
MMRPRILATVSMNYQGVERGSLFQIADDPAGAVHTSQNAFWEAPGEYALLGGALGGVKLRTNRRQGQTEQGQVVLAWSYSAVVYLTIVVLTLLILQRPQPNPCFSKAL